MNKDTHTKARSNFSVDKKVDKDFNALTEKLAINKSALIEKYMLRWIVENKDRELK